MKYPNIGLLVFTDGRRECLEQALSSALNNLNCHFMFKRIINDSPDSDYQAHLLETYGNIYEIYNNPGRLGFCGTISRAWSLLPDNCDYIFHLEDDFVFNEKIDVFKMVWVLEANPYLAQMALLRQPWNSEEIEKGGILKVHPEAYKECTDGSNKWLENGICMTTNPNVYPRRITRFTYPPPPHGEGKFGIMLRDKFGYKFAYWGALDQSPKVHHIGRHRVGTGY